MSVAAFGDGLLIVMVRWSGERRLSLTVRRVVAVLDRDKEVLETAEQRHEEERQEKRFLYSITDHGKTGGQ